MEVVSNDVSSNPRDSKQYNRTIYVCKFDDAWVTVEVPRESV